MLELAVVVIALALLPAACGTVVWLVRAAWPILLVWSFLGLLLALSAYAPALGQAAAILGLVGLAWWVWRKANRSNGARKA